MISTVTPGEKPDLLDYPNTPGWNDTRTSIEAAEDVVEKAPPVRNRIMTLLRSHMAAKELGPGLTADEIADLLELEPLYIRPRVTELHKQGLIEDTGLCGRNLSGKRAIIWAAVENPGDKS